MKFLVAVAGLLLPLVNAKKISKKALRNAIKGPQRRLDEFEITSEYDIMFNSCLNFKVENENMFDENFKFTDEVQSGELDSMKSYVIFSICDADMCYYKPEDKIYATTLEDWVESTVGYYEQKRERFCQQCEQFQEYCENVFANADDAAGDDAARRLDEAAEEEEEDADDGKNYIDCYECANNKCFEEEPDDDNFNPQDEDVVQYIQEYAQCNQLEVEFDDDQYEEGLYARLICDEDEAGYKLGVFLDNECTLYAKDLDFEDYIVGDDDEVEDFKMLYELHDDVLKLSYSNVLSCDATQVEYDDPDADDDADDDDAQEAEVAEACGNVLQNAVNLDPDLNCEIENDDDQQEEEEENDNDWYYEYEISQEDADDIQAVCGVIHELEYEYVHYNIIDNADDESNKSSRKSGASGGKGWLIVLAILVIIAIGYLIYTSTQSNKTGDKNEPLYKGGQMS